MATVPITVDGAMDFLPGPSDQVVQKIVVTGQPDAAQLDAAGLHVTDVLGGQVPMTATVIERRGGSGSIAINGDLTLATLSVDPLAWRKPPGGVANMSATLQMSHDRLSRIDHILLRGDGLLLNGSAEFAGARIRTAQFDSVRLGQTQGHGTIHFPPNMPIAIVLQGDQIDLAPKLTERSNPARPNPTPVVTPDWTLDARFNRAILANQERAGDVLIKATGGGAQIRLLDAIGTLQGTGGQASAGFTIRIDPRPGGRHLLVEAKNAGGFLAAVDAVRGMRSGHLLVDGGFDRPFGLEALSGTATIDNAVIRNSPAFGKLLQAITLYGLVDALRGPGMAFSRIITPFRYDGTEVFLDEGHAYNASLGLTATGRINLASGQTSLTGTIVPAYFFNSIPGRLPLVGKLFSPEKGGGLFAARFAVDGPIEDPTISLNPVSALTPGFLRGVFDVFHRNTASKEPTPAQ